MAWSDAARAAALEARRAKSHATTARRANVGLKKSYAATRGEERPYSTSNETNRMIQNALSKAGGSFVSARKMVAKQLKSLRSGKSNAYRVEAEDIGYTAALLTRLRNTTRRSR